MKNVAIFHLDFLTDSPSLFLFNFFFLIKNHHHLLKRKTLRLRCVHSKNTATLREKNSLKNTKISIIYVLDFIFVLLNVIKISTRNIQFKWSKTIAGY